MTAIEVEGLTKVYGTTSVVDDATFLVPRAAVTGLVGANGSGKTTLLRMILGLVRPTAGRATIDGVPYRDLQRPRHMVGAVVDRLGANPGHSARRHLSLLSSAGGIPEAAVDETLAAVGLSDVADQALGRYSMGMRQRTAIAAAMLAAPPIVILDEPTNGLDPGGIRWLRDLMRSWADDGRTVLICTHQLADLSPIVDHLIVLDHGATSYAGPAAAFRDRHPSGSLEEAVFDRLADKPPHGPTPASPSRRAVPTTEAKT